MPHLIHKHHFKKNHDKEIALILVPVIAFAAVVYLYFLFGVNNYNTNVAFTTDSTQAILGADTAQ
jgi:hypothetical protein